MSIAPTYFFENDVLELKKGYRRFFLFLDFDGTLVPIRDKPETCFLSPHIRDELEVLMSSPDIRIAILSGRSLPDLRKRINISGIYYGGNHGLDISGPDIVYTHPVAVSTKGLIGRISRQLKKEIAEIDGARLETKGLTFALHYRLSNKESGAAAREAFWRIFAENNTAGRLKVLKGKKVLELAPDVSWDKGKAARFLLEQIKAKHLPLYVGDDLTDETAFQALRDEGITVRVGYSKKTAGKYFLRDQKETGKFLRYMGALLLKGKMGGCN